MYKNERTAHLKKRMIGDTPFTIEWVLKALNDKQSDWTNASAGRRVSTILAQKIGEGKGYASNVYKLTVEFDRGEPYYLALKIPTPEIFLKKFEQPNANESHVRSNIENSIAAAHSRECNFYRTFSGKGLCLPVIYAAQELIPGKQPGAILMQYMGDVGCNVPPHESFTLKQLVNAAHCFAYLHAYSLSLPQSQLQQLHVFEQLPETWVNLFVQFAPKTIADDHSMQSAYEKLKHLFESVDFPKYLVYSATKKLGMKMVIVHGDAWNNNIFVGRNADGSPSSNIVAIIDWQTVHGGSVGEDLARIMCASNPDIRREAEKVALDAYYETFTQEMKRRNLENPHTKAQVITAYRQAYVAQALLSLVGAHVLNDGREKLSGLDRRISEARYQNWLLRCKLALEDAVQIVETDFPEWLDHEYKFQE